jgi:cytochrome c556
VRADQVVSYVNRDRAGLARHAQELAGHARAIENAAKAHDSVKALLLAEELDQICESCHLKFWYPEQEELTSKRKP